MEKRCEEDETKVESDVKGGTWREKVVEKRWEKDVTKVESDKKGGNEVAFHLQGLPRKWKEGGKKVETR